MTKRRAHGEGGLYQTSKGNWIGAVDLGVVNGKRKRKTVSGKTRNEVLAKLRKLKNDIESGVSVLDDQMTVEQWLSRWQDVYLPMGNRSEATLANYRWATTYVIEALGNKKLQRLTPADVANMLAGLQNRENLSQSSLRRIRSALISALKCAEKWGLVNRNVAMLVEAPAGKVAEKRSLTIDQTKAFLEAATGTPLEAAWVTKIMGGLRPGEVFGLGLNDLDDDDVLHIHQALKHPPKGPAFLGKTKNKKSTRSIRLAKPAADLLRAAITRQSALIEEHGPTWNTMRLIFTTSQGTPIDSSNSRRELDRITALAGIGHWTPYELRHTNVSLLSHAYVPLEVIADVVGHSSTRMTETVYRHPLTKSFDAAVCADGGTVRRCAS